MSKPDQCKSSNSINNSDNGSSNIDESTIEKKKNKESKEKNKLSSSSSSSGLSRKHRHNHIKRKTSRFRLRQNSSSASLSSGSRRRTRKDPAYLKKQLLSKEDVDRTQWRELSIEGYPPLRDLIERVEPIQRVGRFGEIYKPFTKKTKDEFKKEHVHALVLQYFQLCGYKNAYESLSKATDARPPDLVEGEAPTLPNLVKFLRYAVMEVENIYDLTIADKGSRETELEAALFDIGLLEEQDDGREDINIWEDDREGMEVIVIEGGEEKLRQASLNKIVCRMTNPSTASSVLMKTFLMTYHMYTTAQHLLDKLFERYDVPYTDDPEQQKIYSTIQLRVVNVLKKWMEDYTSDFTPTMHQLVNRFVIDPYTNKTHSESLRTTLQKIKRHVERKRTKQDFPEPRLPKNVFSTRLTIDDLDDVEIARQLTLTEFSLLEAIRPEELLDQAWNKKKLQSRAQNVLAIISRFNEISHWCATKIVGVPYLKQRTKMLEKFINIAKILNQFHNYNTLMAILAGINMSSVDRLKHTRNSLPGGVLETLNQLEETMSANSAFKIYRASIARANPPCIPYLGVYLTDLTFIDENPNRVDGLINYTKLELLYDVIARIQQYQMLPYQFQPVYQIQHLMLNLMILGEADLYRLSLEREPRGATRNEIK